MNPETILLRPSSEEAHCTECNQWEGIVLQFESLYLCMPCAWKLVAEIKDILKGRKK